MNKINEEQLNKLEEFLFVYEHLPEELTYREKEIAEAVSVVIKILLDKPDCIGILKTCKNCGWAQDDGKSVRCMNPPIEGMINGFYPTQDYGCTGWKSDEVDAETLKG